MVISTVYKYIGISFVSVFIMMMIPIQDTPVTGPTLYGLGTIIVKDAQGSIVFTQTVHNRLVDQGETFIIDQTFDDGTASMEDNASIGTICISGDSNFTSNLNENLTALTFDSNDGLSSPNCKQASAGSVSDATQGIAIVSPSPFTTSNLDSVGGTVYGIGICQSKAGDDNDFADCTSGGSGNGILFAAVDTSDVTLNTDETIIISYTFDITSSNT